MVLELSKKLKVLVRHAIKAVSYSDHSIIND